MEKEKEEKFLNRKKKKETGFFISQIVKKDFFGRCMYLADFSVSQNLEKIAKDSSLGSSIIEEKVLKVLMQFLKNESGRNLHSRLKKIMNFILSAHPDMAVLYHLFSDLHSVSQIKENPKKRCQEYICARIKEKKEFPKSITHFGRKLVGRRNSFLTISYSKNVMDFLLGLDKKMHVYAMESRPKMEGKKLAKKLASSGIETTIIMDNAFHKYLQQVSIVLVGADRITEDFFINKMGTFSLCYFAFHLRKKVMLITETTKFLPSKNVSVSLKRGIDEKMSSHLSIKSPFFEKIPLAFIHDIVTENGVLHPRKKSKK